ncbi:MAG TPA: hypothetical protein VMU09_10295 [Acidimicrobiales bacterium]|nr:hypothetical protein [Acidimicrobiales bacterium]
MTEDAHVDNEPAEFPGDVPRHRLFAVLDDSDAAEEAVEALRFEGYLDDKQVWVFVGDEGIERLDRMGQAHRLWARGLRSVRRAMSSDLTYVHTLHAALRDGRVVVAVWVRNERAADEVGRLLHSHNGHSFAYFTHWDFVPVAA